MKKNMATSVIDGCLTVMREVCLWKISDCDQSVGTSREQKKIMDVLMWTRDLPTLSTFIEALSLILQSSMVVYLI